MSDKKGRNQPPVSTRFRKGQSGNPRGRPRKRPAVQPSAFDVVIDRTLTITQASNSVCVFDYVVRLAFGSHLFPGSSLHANLLNEAYGTGGVGNKAVSIPVRQILPQTIAKEMDAVQGGTHEWSITKGASPGNIVFDDTCGEVPPAPQLVTLTVTWTKSEVIPGEVMVTTDISATNPAHRTITVQVTDEIFGDIGAGDESLDVFACAAVEVPAGSTGYPVCTHVTNVASNATALNDIATATYIDPVTGVPVPGTTEATASTDIQPGSIFNTTAEITDSGFIHLNGAEVLATITAPSGETRDLPLEWTVQTDGEYRVSEPGSLR